MKKTASTQVYEYSLNGLIERRYSPGTPLREERFCEECGCSATPVREAFRQLEKEGWLVNQPYKGCSVRVFSEAEVAELFLLREALECRAVCAIIENKVTDLSPLEDAISEMAEQLGTEQLAATDTFHGDLHFHRALLELAQLPRLASYTGLWDSQLRTFTVSGNWQLSPEAAADIIDQHRAILSAIRRGWLRSAESLVRDHLTQGHTQTIALMHHQLADNVCDTPAGKKKNLLRKGFSFPPSPPNLFPNL